MPNLTLSIYGIWYPKVSESTKYNKWNLLNLNKFN